MGSAASSMRNVGEWCAGAYGPYPLPAPADGPGTPDPESKDRVWRGGSYLGAAEEARSTRRIAYEREQWLVG